MSLIFRNFWNTLRRYKVASILNILGLSVAFAAFAIIMMQVRYELTYDKSHENADRIFRVEYLWVDGGYMPSVSMPVVELIGRSFPEIEATGAVMESVEKEVIDIRPAHRADTEYPFAIEHQEATPGLFEVFDFNWAAGDASQFSQPNTVVIPQSWAERIFPDTPAVGQYLVERGVDSIQLRIVGVYRDFPQNSTLRNAMYQNRIPVPADRMWGHMQYLAFVRVKAPDQAGELAGLIGEAVKENSSGNFDDNPVFRLANIRDTHYSTDVPFDVVEKVNLSRTHLFLLIAVLIVTIALINFMNFSNALVPARLRTVNTQKVFGCSNRQIRRMMLFEAVGICGIAAAIAIWIVSAVAKTGLTRLMVAPIDWGANLPLLFGVIGAALLAGVIAGIYPAFYITSFPTALVIKGSFGLSPRGKRLRQVLISFQYVISLALIIVALFIHVQSNYMKTLPTGFDRQNLLQVQIPGPVSSRSDAFRERLLQNPAIRQVAFSNSVLVSEVASRFNTNFGEEAITFDYRAVSDNYIGTVGIRITEGRDFTPADAEKEGVTLLFNETARQQYGLKLGDRINLNNAEVIGFFSDINYKPFHTGIEPMAILIRNTGSRFSFRHAFVRVDGAGTRSTIEYIDEVVREMDPEYAGGGVTFVDQGIAQLYGKEDDLALLITLFSVVAIVISLIGIFGLVMFEGRYRRKEIGLRKVHGATIGEILRLLNQNFVRIVLVCFVIAAPIAYYAIRRWLEGFAYQSPVHWWIFATALLAVGAITVLTVTLQSYRAATENPVNAIKTE